jgi:hypothetical protein
MTSTLTRKQLTSGVPNGKFRDLDEILRERMDQFAGFAMAVLVVAYATYAFVL